MTPDNTTPNDDLRFDDTPGIRASVSIDQRCMFTFTLMPDALEIANRVIALANLPAKTISTSTTH